MNKRGKRLGYAIIFFMLLAVEVVIALFVHDNFVRPYVGDVIVVVVVYCFARIFVPNGIRIMPLYVFIFAIFVEILQYFHIVKLLGLEENIFANIVLGSTFDLFDIFCYGVGCLLLVCYEWFRYKRI